MSFCELLAAHTELRFAAVCVALFSGFVYPFLIGALVRLRAKENGVAFPTLASHDDLVRMARGYRQGIDLLRGWRRALALMMGEAAPSARLRRREGAAGRGGEEGAQIFLKLES